MPLPSTILYPASGGGGGGAGTVVGPGSSTAGNLASFGDTSGALLADSGVVAANVVTGPASATDNAIVRFDSTTGKIIQDSAVTIADLSAGAVTLATTAGNALTIKNTDPTATTGASVAGDAFTIQAGNAVASTDTAGAADGGDVYIVSGNAARNASGDGRGGVIKLLPGSGVGAGGNYGGIRLFLDSASGVLAYNARDVGVSGATGIVFFNGTASSWEQIWGFAFRNSTRSTTVSNGLFLQRGTSSIGSTAGQHGGTVPSAMETGFGSYSAGVWSSFKATPTDPAPILQAVLVEANTAGSGSPNVIAANESSTIFINEGATAKNYHTLPTAVAGYVLTFCCQDADGIRVTASGGDTIRVIDKVTAAAGYIESTTIGSTVTLISINATEWFATSINGVWTDGTWSYDDTSLTSP